MPQIALDDEKECASYLKAMGDPLRIRIVRALQFGIVETRREGKFIYYSLNKHLVGTGKRKNDHVLNFGCCELDVGRSAS